MPRKYRPTGLSAKQVIEWFVGGGRSFEECWDWPTLERGYGMVRFEGRRWRSHRLAFMAWGGILVTPLQIDHLCRNKACCNPRHLEQVTGRDNQLRADGFIGANARKTHCLRGHEFTYMPHYKKPQRICRTCQQRRKLRQEEAASVVLSGPQASQDRAGATFSENGSTGTGGAVR